MHAHEFFCVCRPSVARLSPAIPDEMRLRVAKAKIAAAKGAAASLAMAEEVEKQLSIAKSLAAARPSQFAPKSKPASAPKSRAPQSKTTPPPQPRFYEFTAMSLDRCWAFLLGSHARSGSVTALLDTDALRAICGRKCHALSTLARHHL